METELLDLDTRGTSFLDVTDRVERFVGRQGSDGIVHLFAPHATAGLALIETGSGTERDLEDALERLLPREDIYTHRHGSQGHGADHVIPAFISPSLSIPVVNGKLVLGTWQSIVFVDLNRDNPARHLRLSYLPG